MDSKTYKLSEIANLSIGITINKTNSNYTDNKISYNQVTLNSVRKNKNVILYKDNVFYSKEAVKSSYITEEGDLLLRLREPLIASYVDKDSAGAVATSLFCIIRCKDIVDPKYLLSYINSELFSNISNKYLSGSAVRMMNISSLRDIKIKLPSMVDQERVANLLELHHKELDILLNLQVKKQDILKQLTRDLFK